MREVDVAGLLAASEDPVVHHQLDHRRLVRAWVDGPAVVVRHTVGWRGAPDGVEAVLALGPGAALGPLAARVDALVGPPWRTVVDAPAHDALPAAWRPATARDWHWMTTRAVPVLPDAPAVVEVGPVGDDEVSAVLDVANPDSFARPGGGRVVEQWLGARVDGDVAAVGALVRHPSGSGVLSGITTLPGHRGQGLGAAVTTELTRRALAVGPGLCTLGVWTDNPVAVRLYERLGYAVARTFASGVTGRV
ncbi:GNAT family N-acetyltransferase [Nocardioides litoris]|uniref:GNAT family N-acetyltransferase n=1 Tax=Nocardioides litoris TaxID=1926648 RepID=UPI00111F272C|nr:GNAT family N-acetyltransferase [Nocardioides litoris]